MGTTIDERLREVVRWIAGVGERYVAAYLTARHIDTDRLASDRKYGLKVFLFQWAYERQGAPKGYRIAAVKAVESAWHRDEDIPVAFRRYLHGEPNEHINPALAPHLKNLDIPDIVELVKKGDVERAYKSIVLPGIGPKIKSFFLRDLITLFDCEAELDGDRPYLFCQPIDVWVMNAVGYLALPQPSTSPQLDFIH